MICNLSSTKVVCGDDSEIVSCGASNKSKYYCYYHMQSTSLTFSSQSSGHFSKV